ncbi:MAG: hypothetical protein IJH34_10090 [Romboutsia sp.]|nr:hypothetical protein [Romboutsia sp.]
MGYLGHYDGLNQDNIRVEFNLLDLNILINKDLDTIKYVSNERFEEIMSNLTDEEGYGDDWDCYLETSVEIVGDVKDGKLVLSDNIYNIFSKEVVKQIVDMFNGLLDNRLR